jgi:transcriptional regulator with XRE-family HTH domain
MTLTESIRSAVIDMRHDGEAIRPFAARLGVPHMTLYRFLCGTSVDSDTLDRLALAAGVSPSTGDDRLREAAQRVSDRARVIARGGASPRWVVDDATFSALRAALSTRAPDTEEPA